MLRSITLLFLMLATPGCITFYSFKPVQLSVVDAETGKPIPYAQIKIWHGDDTHIYNPPLVEYTADQQGCATIQVGARCGGAEGRAYWCIEADGYAAEDGFAPQRKYIPDRFRLREEEKIKTAVVKLYVWEHRPSDELRYQHER